MTIARRGDTASRIVLRCGKECDLRTAFVRDSGGAIGAPYSIVQRALGYPDERRCALVGDLLTVDLNRPAGGEGSHIRDRDGGLGGADRLRQPRTAASGNRRSRNQSSSGRVTGRGAGCSDARCVGRAWRDG